MGVRFWEIATNHPSLWAQWIGKNILEEAASGQLLHQLQVRSFGGKSSKQGTGFTTVPSILFSMVNLSISGMTHGYRGAVRQQSLVAHISWLSSIGSSGTEKKVLLYALTQVIWSIWLERNARVSKELRTLITYKKLKHNLLVPVRHDPCRTNLNTEDIVYVEWKQTKLAVVEGGGGQGWEIE
ncbi:hypothetical protein QJS10_CPB12g01035 [Acorus calamus]|uniref:Uncharacterized protein n=1 Tax=Acorus calamus TaxID=4465 RepID=A0AAV9DLR9_ACOCL|nr:hypothetical protein QJS10_CPB12g01035 [Acorus calamus]